MPIQSVVPLEEKLLATWRRVTLAQLIGVEDALEDGVLGWKTLGFKAQVEKAVREFVRDAWALGEKDAQMLLDWGKRRKGPKPLKGDSESVVAKEARPMSLAAREAWQPEYILEATLAAKRPLAVGLAEVPPAEGLAWYENYMLSLAGVAEQELLDKTKKVVAHAAEVGLTSREIRDELHGLFESFPRYRLSNIIRTESAHIFNTSSLTRYTKDPMITAYRYLVTEDDRTTDICQGYVDKVGPANELSDVPPLHFQCRTVLEPMFAWETFTPSDMADLKPMAGFGTPFPRGTGLPGVKPFPLARRMPAPKPVVPPEKMDAVESLYAERLTRQLDYVRARASGTPLVALERKITARFERLLDASKAATTASKATRQEVRAFFATNLKQRTDTELIVFAQRRTTTLMTKAELDGLKTEIINRLRRKGAGGYVGGRLRLGRLPLNYVRDLLRQIPARHLAEFLEARGWTVSFVKGTRGGTSFRLLGGPPYIKTSAPALYHEFAHFLTDFSDTIRPVAKQRWTEFERLYSRKGRFHRGSWLGYPMDEDDLISRYSGRIYNLPVGTRQGAIMQDVHGIEYPSEFSQALMSEAETGVGVGDGFLELEKDADYLEAIIQLWAE